MRQLKKKTQISNIIQNSLNLTNEEKDVYISSLNKLLKDKKITNKLSDRDLYILSCNLNSLLKKSSENKANVSNFSRRIRVVGNINQNTFKRNNVVFKTLPSYDINKIINNDYSYINGKYQYQSPIDGEIYLLERSQLINAITSTNIIMSVNNDEDKTASLLKDDTLKLAVVEK